MLAGAWLPLTLASGFSAVFGTPSVRLEGDAVRFKGSIKNTSGATQTDAVVASIPAGFQPVNPVFTATGLTNVTGDSPITIQFATNQIGIGPNGESMPNLAILGLDGLTYTLS
jgi:hypothetical protein